MTVIQERKSKFILDTVQTVCERQSVMLMLQASLPYFNYIYMLG